MYELIEINGEARPLRFGMNALRLFCRDQKISLSEISTLGQDMSLDSACSLILCGLKDGARKAGKNCPLTVDDIADALDEDFSLLEKAMGIFSESFNTINEGNVQGPKCPKKKKK